MIAAYIMAVPWDVQRAKRASMLRKATEGTVVWDQTQNAMDTFRLMLEQIVNDGDHAALILEDDVQLAPNWREKVEAVIAERPNQVIQFFSMRPEAEERSRGSREMDGKTFISNLCVYLPAGYAGALLSYSYDFVEKYPQFKTANDFVIRYWLRERREKFWLQVPSLVQHESWVSSINAKRPRWRKSHFFDGGAES